MKKCSLYGFVSLISIFVRQFVLPNPFECFGDQAIIINWIVEPIIQAVAYILVGSVYQKGSNPAFGSLLFLLTYALIVGILWLLGIFNFAWWWALILIIAFIGIVIGIRWISNKLSDNDYNYYD